MPSTSSYSITSSKTTLKWSTVGKFMTAPILRSSASRKGKENGMVEVPGKKPLAMPSTSTLVDDGKTSSSTKVTLEAGDVITSREETVVQLNAGQASSSRISLSTLGNLSSSQIRRSSPSSSAIQKATVAEEADIGLSPLAALDPTGPSSNSAVPPSNESPHLEYSKNHINIPVADDTPRGSSSLRIEELTAENGRLVLDIQTLKDELAQTKELEQIARKEAEENLLAQIRTLEEERSLHSESIGKITGDLDDARLDRETLRTQLDESNALVGDLKGKYDTLSEAFEGKKRDAERQASEAQLRQHELEKEKMSIEEALEAAVSDLARIRGDYEDKEAQLESERKRADAIKAENERLEENLRTYTKDLEDLQQATTKATTDLEVTRAELSGVRSGWESSLKQNKESHEKIKSLEAQQQVKERERETLEELHAQQKRTLEGALVDLESTKRERDEARKSLQDNVDQVESLKGEKRELLDDRQTKIKELEALRRFNTRAINERNTTLSDLTRARGEVEDIKSRLEENQKLVRDSAKQKEVLLEELAKLRNLSTTKDNQLQAVTAELKKTELERKETQARLEGQIRNLVDERQEGLKELETLRGTYEKTAGSLEAAVLDLKRVQVERKEAREKLEGTLARNKELEKENKESEKRNLRLLEEWKAKEKELKEQREGSFKAAHALETSLSELERLRQDLKAAHSRLEDISKQRSMLEDQARYLEEAFASKEKERHLLWEENYKQSQAVETAISEMKASWQREADTQARLRDAEKRLEEIEEMNDDLEERNRLLVLDAARPLPALPGLVRAFIRPGALW